MNHPPTLSLGCAVYRSNEASLRRALDSVRGQTFGDFEVIICDNSPPQETATRDICLDYVSRDARFRYCHNDVNLGAYPSFWRTFHLASGRYFKWVADDDVLDPNYFGRCIRVLEDDPSIALCYTQVRMMTPSGEALDRPGARIAAMQDSAFERIIKVLEYSWEAHGFYGIFRTRHLRRIHPIHDDCVRLADILLLAEISLHGKIHQIPECLFTYTQHEKDWSDREKLNAGQYRSCFSNKPLRGITFPNLKFAYELLQAVRYSDLPLPEKSKLYTLLPRMIEQRISGHWTNEITRAANLVLNQRILHDWGDSTGPLDSARRWVEVPGAYQFHAAELLMRIEEVMAVWPHYPNPGLHSMRAVLLALVERVPEAQAALQIEIQRFPTFEPARRLLQNLEAGMRKRSAG